MMLYIVIAVGGVAILVLLYESVKALRALIDKPRKYSEKNNPFRILLFIYFYFCESIFIAFSKFKHWISFRLFYLLIHHPISKKKFT
jgi:hypothetical protein